MKALVSYRVDVSEVANRGVAQKLLGQCHGLQANGYEVDCLYLNEDGIMYNETLVKEVRRGGMEEVLMKYKGFFQTIASVTLKKTYDLIILRFTSITPSFITMLSRIRNSNGKVKILLDLPTYPYAQEFTGIKGKALFALDKRLQSKLERYIDFIIHYGEGDSIWGIPTIRISNGILVNTYQDIDMKLGIRPFSLLAVGKWNYWHGLERVMRGLDSETHLHIIGDGSTIPFYRREAGAAINITFHGPQSGSRLKEIASECHIGIGTLGIHRKGIKIDSSLKHRMYCMMGLPFILGSKDFDFPEECGFVKYFPGDKMINSNEIKSFYEGLKIKKSEIVSYGKEKLDWKMKMRYVLERSGMLNKL